MRLISFGAKEIPPISIIQAEDLSDVVVIAGPNGVGKSRFLQWLLGFFQNPHANPNAWAIIDATSDAEREEWGKARLDTRNAEDSQILRTTLQKPTRRRRGDLQSSVLNFESDRKITNVQPFTFSWDYQDPYLEDIGWQYGFTPLSNRFSDTVHSIFRKVRSQRENMALRLEQLVKEKRTEKRKEERPEDKLVSVSVDEFPDPLIPFKAAFSQLLAPKQLEEPDPKKQQLFYLIGGHSFPVTSLSSGEREVVNIVFDFLLRNPSDCIVVFDEPELHLHPELSYKLIQTLRSSGIRNQFIFCTHSAEIISASLENSVLFITPPKGPDVNQAVRVSETDETHQALKLVGQSIGIVALGKKLVLIEGTQGSLDKETYGAILRADFPGLVLVPSGGKGLIHSFQQLAEQVLRKTIWGVEFFMLCDGDVAPVRRDVEDVESRSAGRLRVLPRYHLENYFLDEEVIRHIFSNFETEGSERSWLRDSVAIQERLKSIAKGSLSYAAALIASAHFRERAGNVDLMPPDCYGKSTDELITKFNAEATSERSRLQEALDPLQIEEFVKTTMIKLEQSLVDQTWKSIIPAKPIVRVFCSGRHANLELGRFKTAYISAARSSGVDPFREIREIFAEFSRVTREQHSAEPPRAQGV